MDAVEQISDKTFVKEMRILWQNVEHSRRKWLEELIRAYFSDAKRADKIIAKLNRNH